MNIRENNDFSDDDDNLNNRADSNPRRGESRHSSKSRKSAKSRKSTKSRVNGNLNNTMKGQANMSMANLLEEEVEEVEPPHPFDAILGEKINSLI